MSEELTLASPEVVNMTADAEKTLEVVKVYDELDDDMYSLAGREILDIKSKMKTIKETRMAITRPIDAAKKGVMDFFRAPMEHLEKAEKILNGLMIEYRGKKKAERQAAEEAARVKQKKIDDEAEAEAAKLRAAGKTEEAEAVEAEAEAAPPAVQIDEIEEVKGVHTRKNYKFRITDASKIPAEYLIPDEKKIGQVVRAMKDMASIPGVEVYCDEKISTRT